MHRESDDETVPGVATGRGVSAVPHQWELVVCTGEVFTTHALGSTPRVTIGRGADNAIVIADGSISRAHARLVLGERVQLIDLDSRNGTRVDGRKLPPLIPCELSGGEALELGSVMAVLQRVAVDRPLRSVLQHEYFQARLEEEVSRRRRVGGSFVVVRVHFTSGGDAARREAALNEALRAHDVVALYGPGEYEVLIDADADAGARVAARIERILEGSSLAAKVGIARYPADGATSDELLTRANEAVRGQGPDAQGDVALYVPGSPMAGLRELVARVARSNISVLILGETGVGKEVTAEMVHRLSPRADKTFLRLNCAALTETLLESELFGHERGAFTGAVAAKPGLLETAAGGTVFLDEVGELPLSTQVKLLRVIEDRKVTRVGGLQSRSIDVRFVAATNRNLDGEIARGAFRQDLFFRLNGLTVVVPPLRQRKEEILRLAGAFAAQASAGATPRLELSADARQLLLEYPWPGNIRELRNVIERAVLMSGGARVGLEHLPLERMRAQRVAGPPPVTRVERAFSDPAPSSGPGGELDATGQFSPPSVTLIASGGGTLRSDIDALERERILGALEQCAWNQTQAARLLGISRGTLIARLDQYNVGRPRKGR